MKLFNTLVALSFSTLCIAQPTIQISDAISIGSTFTLISGTWSDQPATGTNVSWNYSSAGAGATYNLSISDASSNSYFTYFPNATMVLTGDGNNTFMSKDAGAVYTHGFATAFGRVVMDSPMRQIAYPISMATDWSATATGMQNTTPLSISSSNEAVGYGTVILPWGQIENVIRIMTVSASTVSGSPQSVTVDSLATYYVNGFPWYVARALTRRSSVGGVPQTVQRNFLYAGESDLVGIPEQQRNSVIVQAFPNPTSDMLTIAAVGLGQGAQLEVFDASGRPVQVGMLQPISNLVQLDVSNWASGLYVVRVTQADGSMGSTRSMVR